MKGILGSGTRDYIWIRITAIILGSYFILISSVLILNSPLSFEYWTGLYGYTWMKIFTSLSVFAFSIHAWLGTWAVGTDYLTPLRLGEISKYIYGTYRIICTLVILTTLIWSIIIPSNSLIGRFFEVIVSFTNIFLYQIIIMDQIKVVKITKAQIIL